MSKTKKYIGTFLAPNKGMTIVGNHAYGYSGAVPVSNSETTLIDHMTGDNYFVGRWTGHFNQASNASVETEDYRFVLYLNGMQVMELVASDSSSQNRNNYRNLIIPPNTNVKITCQNYEGSTSNDMGATITGQIHG